MDRDGAHGEISRASPFIRDVLLARVRAVRAGDAETLAEPLGAHAIEFDDVRLAASSVREEKGKDAVDVSVGAPPGAMDGARARADAEALCASGTATRVRDKANAGYDLTLRVDVSELAAMESEAARMEVIERAARVRSAVYGAKLRAHLRALGETGGTEGALDWHTRRPGETMFIKPQKDQVTVVFPMRFEDARDAVIATQFLTHFAEVRRTQKDLSTAPAVSYIKTPPLELKEAPEELLNVAATNGGYVSFVLFKRHVAEDRLESTVWNILTFHAFVSFHIKYSKAYWHSRMRNKVESWLSILKRAKKSDPNGPKKMTTASGRTFVRK
ncbi:ARP2/3 complex, 34kDa subunit (p34-Arc) [Ostreococcus tauri]|uniref:Arp2/3 complex 34 kDa subunit n=1 Tax=Ostreococcus tauri TaxID=70448 RepID=Q01CA0_OSTTA|nr:ARP2/3 complex, 34kDa subunit (p34-Arc) [Ostreococcus tauri]CAL53053.1 ARP2/3 complex, 34kDa subunit (p34-Arc) [Ostreococcus tauri]|eukprot:XP_003078313.1 ARP2/3 complex, 34kDa subunit (p34-Arc) [Ostreococcus tauri]